MECDFNEGCKAADAAGLPIVCLDTCVWLEFLRGRNAAREVRANLVALQKRIGIDFQVVVPNQVKVEFLRNKDSVIREYQGELEKVVNGFAKYVEDFHGVVLPDLPLLTGNYLAFLKNQYEIVVQKILLSSLIYEPLPCHYQKAAIRSCERRAPSERRGSSSADSVIIESYMGLIDVLRNMGCVKRAYFVTLNTRDFSEHMDAKSIHHELRPDFQKLNISYFSNFNCFINVKTY